MCLIIVADRPQKNPITHGEIKRAIAANKDGYGVAALYKDGTLSVTKGFGEKEAWQTIKTAQRNGAHIVVFHARLATSGYIERSQCHPYTMNAPSGEKRVLFHNGVLHGIPMPNGDRSDTWHLAKTLSRYETTPKFLSYLDEYAKEQHSRFVVLSSAGFYIANEQSGVKRDGKWYSGYSAFPPSKPEETKWSAGGFWSLTLKKWIPYDSPEYRSVIAGTQGASYFAKDADRLAMERETDVLDIPEASLNSDEEFIRWLERNDTPDANDSIRNYDEGNS